MWATLAHATEPLSIAMRLLRSDTATVTRWQQRGACSNPSMSRASTEAPMATPKWRSANGNERLERPSLMSLLLPVTDVGRN